MTQSSLEQAWPLDYRKVHQLLRVARLGMPCLVLAGETDILIPVALSRALHRAIPGARWATTRGGHACLWEHPQEFNVAVLEFLDSVPEARS